jgi:hypothetical protein
VGLQRLEITMTAIFLSASIPEQDEPGIPEADPLLIHAAIRAFLALVLGRRHIVWGGHPSITPMVHAACTDLGLEYLDCVTLYQSLYFKDIFPVDNEHFDDVVLVSEESDLQSSLQALREEMFEQNDFEAAVFIGGKRGVEDEYVLLNNIQPSTVLVPLHAPGGVAAELALRSGYQPDADEYATDFTSYLIEKLGVTPSELRNTISNKKKPGARP